MKAIRLVIRGVCWSLSSSSSFIRLNSRLRPTQVYAIHTIIRVVELLTSLNIEWGINDRFPMLNNTYFSFTILYSYEEVCKNIEYGVISVKSIIIGTKYEILQLFTTSEKGVYWV